MMADYSEEIETAEELINEFGGDCELIIKAEKDVFGGQTKADTVLNITAVLLASSAGSSFSGAHYRGSTEILTSDKYCIFTANVTTENLEQKDFSIKADGITYRKKSCKLLSPDSSSRIIYESMLAI